MCVMLGLFSASGLVCAWLATLYWGLWGMPADHWQLSLALLWPIPVLQWLYVGLFITAHDACHGSVAPQSPRLNAAIGRLCAALYAGLWFDTLRHEHRLHHRHPGTRADPDFAGDPDAPICLWRWAWRFLWHYTRLSQWVLMVGVSQVFIHGCGIAPWRVLAYWAVPAWLSALQLFYFGTYLPHRPHPEVPFVDEHKTRNSGLRTVSSLLTCYHFGYHQVHHMRPHVPWYLLPRAHHQQHSTKSERRL